jgi:hypothetical protein
MARTSRATTSCCCRPASPHTLHRLPPTCSSSRLGPCPLTSNRRALGPFRGACGNTGPGPTRRHACARFSMRRLSPAMHPQSRAPRTRCVRRFRRTEPLPTRSCFGCDRRLCAASRHSRLGQGRCSTLRQAHGSGGHSLTRPCFAGVCRGRRPVCAVHVRAAAGPAGGARDLVASRELLGE